MTFAWKCSVHKSTYLLTYLLTWAFQRIHYCTPEIQDGWDTPSLKSTWRHFFCWGCFDLNKISQTGAEWRLWWYGRNRNQMYNSNMANVWANSMACHPPRATCHIAGWSHLAKSMSWSCHIAGFKNSIRHTENRFSPYLIFFCFLMQFKLWRAAAFVSSPIHLF